MMFGQIPNSLRPRPPFWTSCTTFDWSVRPFHVQEFLLLILPSSIFLLFLLLLLLSRPLSPWWPRPCHPCCCYCCKRIRPLATDHLKDLASLKLSSGGSASCKWSFGKNSLLQMIMWRDRPLANDNPEDPSSCNWSSRGSGLLRLIIWRIRPLAKDHNANPASCNRSSVFKVPKTCNINFRIENDPPPLPIFRKFFRFGSVTHP